MNNYYPIRDIAQLLLRVLWFSGLCLMFVANPSTSALVALNHDVVRDVWYIPYRLYNIIVTMLCPSLVTRPLIV